MSALVFLYDKVLDRPLGDLGKFTRAKRPRRLPVVLSKPEAKALIDALDGAHRLMAGLLYGSGLRLMECVRPRVQDVDFDYGQIVIRDAKGQKDRVVPLPKRFDKVTVQSPTSFGTLTLALSRRERGFMEGD